MEKLAVTPLTSSIGAEIEGVDLRQPVPEKVAEQIRQALWDHGVIALRNQHIDVEQQKRFAAIFGKVDAPTPHKEAGDHEPVVVIEPALWERSAGHVQPLPSFTRFGEEFDGWHVDSCFADDIPHVATLRSEVLPPSGGDTCWASMAAAYEALSPTMQEWLDKLDVVYAAPDGYGRAIGVEELPKEQQEAWEQKHRPRLYPLVARHPRSGRKLIYANPGYTLKVNGLEASESAMLLRFLFTHCYRPQFVLRYRWREGDVVAWDELATNHLAPTDYAPHPRRLTRIMAGTVRPSAARESSEAGPELEVATLA